MPLAGQPHKLGSHGSVQWECWLRRSPAPRPAQCISRVGITDAGRRARGSGCGPEGARRGKVQRSSQLPGAPP